MTDGMFCAQYLSQYQEILSKMRLFGTRNCSKLGRSLYIVYVHAGLAGIYLAQDNGYEMCPKNGTKAHLPFNYMRKSRNRLTFSKIYWPFGNIDGPKNP